MLLLLINEALWIKGEVTLLIFPHDFFEFFRFFFFKIFYSSQHIKSFSSLVKFLDSCIFFGATLKGIVFLHSLSDIFMVSVKKWNWFLGVNLVSYCFAEFIYFWTVFCVCVVSLGSSIGSRYLHIVTILTLPFQVGYLLFLIWLLSGTVLFTVAL